MILPAKTATDNQAIKPSRIDAAYDLGYIHGVHAARDAIERGPSAQAAQRWREHFERRQRTEASR